MQGWKPKLYDPLAKEPFKISRSKLDLFLECPRCFYADKRLGITRPSMPGFSLNSAVDALMKKEFDLLRKAAKPHALMTKYGIDAVPFVHPDMETWQSNFVGQQYLHPKTNLIITGAVDDIWVDKQGLLYIVDYKSTSTDKELSLDDQYKDGYKRQMEIYQWIFKHCGFKVSDLGYFVFANAGKNRPQFDARLEFDLSILPYTGDSTWVEETVINAHACLNQENLPNPSIRCEHCRFQRSLTSVQKHGQESLF
jgi:hypothetical protein